MTTVATVIERLRRTWLEPPDYQPAGTLLSTSIAAGDNGMVLDAFMVPEDEQLLKAGSILEIGSELFRVVGYESATRTCVVSTNEDDKYGTTPSAHTAGSFVRLAPTFPRLSIFEAVRDSIVTLYPKLFTVSNEEVITVSNGIGAISDPLAVEVLSIWPNGWNSAHTIGGRIVEYHPAIGGRALITEGSGELWVRYRRRMGTATAETDTFAELGVEQAWVNIILAGAAADLFIGRDLPASFTDWIGATMEAERIQVGTRYQIGNALRTYRDRLLRDASAEMTSEYEPAVEYLSPWEG